MRKTLVKLLDVFVPVVKGIDDLKIQIRKCQQEGKMMKEKQYAKYSQKFTNKTIYNNPYHKKGNRTMVDERGEFKQSRKD